MIDETKNVLVDPGCMYNYTCKYNVITCTLLCEQVGASSSQAMWNRPNMVAITCSGSVVHQPEVSRVFSC